MLARLLHEPAVRETGQPLLTLLNLKMDLTWFDSDFVVLFTQSNFCLFDMLEIKLNAGVLLSIISWNYFCDFLGPVVQGPIKLILD